MAQVERDQMFGGQLLKLLGIQTDRVVKAVITLEPECWIQIETTSFVEGPPSEGLRELVNRYTVDLRPATPSGNQTEIKDGVEARR